MTPSYTNKGNEEWQALGKKDRPFGPPIRFKLTPEDILAQRGESMQPSGLHRQKGGRSNDR